jgi:hypothetical protein
MPLYGVIPASHQNSGYSAAAAAICLCLPTPYVYHGLVTVWNAACMTYVTFCGAFSSHWKPDAVRTTYMCPSLAVVVVVVRGFKA